MPASIEDNFQLAAFHAFYKAARVGGLDRLNAFVSGIVKSSDEEMEKVLANNPNVVQQWRDFVSSTKTNKTQIERTNHEDH